MDTGVAIASKEQLHIWGQVLACLDLSRASGISSMSCCLYVDPLCLSQLRIRTPQKQILAAQLCSYVYPVIRGEVL